METLMAGAGSSATLAACVILGTWFFLAAYLAVTSYRN